MHQVNPDLPIYRDTSGEGDELRRAIRHASAGLNPGTALNFSAADGTWGSFYDGLFSEHLVALLVEVHAAAVAGEWQQAARADARLSEALGEPSAERNQRAAETVFAARSGARALRQLDKLRTACGGKCCFATAFAVHAAAFNIPLLHAVVAYLSIEWRTGRADAVHGLENSAGWEKLFEQELDDAVEPLSSLLSRSLGGWAEVA